MADSKPIISQPRCWASIAGHDYAPTRVSMLLTTKEVSSCRVSAQADPAASTTGGVGKIADQKISDKLGDMQERLFTKREVPDSSIVMQDENGGTIEFRGFLSNPTYEAAPGAVGINFDIIHESAVLSGYRGFLYTPFFVEYNKKDQNSGIWNPTESNNPAEIFLDILDQARTDWLEKYKNNTDYEQQSFFESQHEQNELLRPTLESVMNDSKLDFPEIAALTGNPRKELQEWILNNCILQRNSSFFDNLSTFESAFQCLMVPQLKGEGSGPARFIPVSDTMENSSPLTLPIVGLTIRGGAKRMMPISNVIIISQSPISFNSKDQTSQTNTGIMRLYAYPDAPLTGGDVIYDTGPPWLVSINTGTAGLQQSDIKDKKSEQAASALDLNFYRTGRVSVNRLLVKTDKVAYMGIIKKWAKNFYQDKALADSSAMVRAPFYAGMVPGSRYDLSDMNGQPVLSGFLHTVQHDMSTHEGKAEVATSLFFSHLEVGGFKLPS